uniref:Uncharacterized protein n=1 Tax=Timema bartmani TaxID=61472 RepID=A0A7R9HXY3_9NEOP|nr:unnamed protein product [Timema bartmani]
MSKHDPRAPPHLLRQLPAGVGIPGSILMICATNSLPFSLVARNCRPAGDAAMLVTTPHRDMMNCDSSVEDAGMLVLYVSKKDTSEPFMMLRNSTTLFYKQQYVLCAMGSFGMTSPRACDTSRLCSGSLGSVRLSLLWWSLVLLSFLAYLSSPTDAAVVARRRNMTNPAFQGAGTEAGLKIWRIEPPAFGGCAHQPHPRLKLLSGYGLG